MSARNVLTEWARLLMASFVDAGVTDIVLSPGSRCTPFMLAAVRTHGLRCHDVIDERAAAFFALGHARATGRPVILLCTSGTAAAHYYPAIIEASAAYIPLIALTADRPNELQECGAPQAVDQVKMYGRFVRGFYDLGNPDSASSALVGLRRTAAQAVHQAAWPMPGPVHLNARARKPLEPVEPETDAERLLTQKVTQLIARPISKPARSQVSVQTQDLEGVARTVREARNGLIVCGPTHLADVQAREAILALAKTTQFPIFAEATSQLRFAPTPADIPSCDSLGLLLSASAFRSQSRPDLIVQFGGTPTTDAFERIAGDEALKRVVVSPQGWQDPAGNADELVFGHAQQVAASLVQLLASHVARDGAKTFARSLAVANDLAWTEVERELARDEALLSEGGVVRELMTHIPQSSILFVGNSLPLRELDVFCRQGCADVGVLCQRGVNGIDGLIAGTAGAANAGHGPTTLLLGDVSFLHDVASLMLLSSFRRPLVILVMQNHGGRIFERLPLARVPGLEPSTFAHVTTPHTFDFSHAARLFGVRHDRVDRHDQLSRVLSAAYAFQGTTVVEAVVPDHGASEQHERLAAAVSAALAASSAWVA